MIIMDSARRLKKPIGRSTYYCHLASTDSTEELELFILGLGLDPKHIQLRGTEKEHYDLMGRNNIHKALSDGAYVVKSILETKRDLKGISKIINEVVDEHSMRKKVLSLDKYRMRRRDASNSGLDKGI